MLKTQFSTESHYRESIRGLLKLHELELSGKSEGEEAEIIRDTLERPWQMLSEREKKRITGLSEDLHSISTPIELKGANPDAQHIIVEACELSLAGRWDEALDLLRSGGDHIEPSLNSYLRGNIWKDAGDNSVAAVFYKHAIQLNPENSHDRSFFLQSFFEVDPASADEIARGIILEHENHRHLAVVKAAEIRYLATRLMSESETQEVLRQIVKVLEPMLSQSEESLSDATYAMAVALLAFCHDHLGNSSVALDYYNVGIGANPRNDALLVARGILRYGQDSGSIRDFETAIQGGTNLIWPYFFSAHHLLIKNEFENCIQVCEHALRLTDSDVLKANLWEWIAISRCESGMSSNVVHAAFEEALRSDPDNDRIRTNFAAFEEAAAAKEPNVSWRTVSEGSVQALGRSQYPLSIAA